MDDSTRAARSVAISYIGISRKSSGKVHDYLLHKGISREISDEVVHQLQKDGYVDDLRIGRTLIASRTARKTEGKAVLLRRLFQAGISREVISQLKEEIPEDRDSILILIDEKLMPELRKQYFPDSFDADLWINKSFRFLLSKGYSSSLSMDALRNRIRDVE